MVFRYVFLLLFSMAVQCEQVLNSSTARLDTMVISPYRHVLTLFTSDIVDKLATVDLAHANRSFSNLPYEFHCTFEEMQLTLQQIASNNQLLLNQVTIHVDELLNSISRLENETEETEILMNELNGTVETAREDVRRKEEAAEKAGQRFSGIVDTLQAFNERRRNNYHRSNHYATHYFPGLYNDGEHRRLFRGSTNCHFGIRDAPEYKLSAAAMHNASDELKMQRQEFESQITKYNSTQSRLRKILKQLMELNATLQQQQIVKTVTDAINGHFQLLANRLKTVSISSKRLIDVLMYAVDYETIVKPLNSVYETLRSENMLDMTDVKLSKEIVENIKQKVTLLTARLPQMRYRRKQFHQPCSYP